LLLARKGFDTFATMRNFNKSKEITDVAKKNLPLQVLELDVTNDRSVVDACNILRGKNSIEVVVNNAGRINGKS